MSRRTSKRAEDLGVRLFCLLAGVFLLLLSAPTRAQEADDSGTDVEATDDAGPADVAEPSEGTEPAGDAEAPEVTKDAEPSDSPEETEGPKADPREEERRKREEAAAAKRKAAEEAAEARRKEAEEKKAKILAEREAERRKSEAARQAEIDRAAGLRKAKMMEQKRREQEASRKRGVKERDDIVLDDKTLMELRKPEDELKREAQIKAARVSLPSDMPLQYLWSLPLERPVPGQNIWVHSDIILMLADESVLYCIRKRDGVPMWAMELEEAPLYPPAVGDRMIYVFVRNTFVGIDRARGEVIWRINPGFAPSAAPGVSEPKLYIPAWDNRVYAIEVVASKRLFRGGRTENDLMTTDHRFRELWHKTTGGYVLGTPALLEGFVYFASEDGYVYSVSQDGEDRYSAQTQGPIRAPVTSRGASVYVGSTDFSAYAFNRLTGKKEWVYPTGSHVFSAIYPDIPAGVALVCSNKNGIFGVCDQPTPERGLDLWHIPDAVSIAGVSPGNAYLVMTDRRLAAVDKKKGTVQWVSLLDGIREVIPTMNDWTRPDDQFRLICLTESGHLACLMEKKEAVRRALETRE